MYCVLMIYCVLNNNTFKLFSREHIQGDQSVELYVVSNVAILSHEEIGMFDSGILI